MTMRELAKLANVSVSAVSKAFSDAKDISLDTKTHIFKIAKEHGCYGKFYKGKYPKRIIAVVCPELQGTHYSTYIEILQNIIESNGGIMLVSTYHFDSTKQLELIEYYSAYLQVDGIIVFNMSPTDKSFDTPIVSLCGSGNKNVDEIALDINSAMSKAIKLLYDLGHKNIAFASEPLTKSKANMFLSHLKSNSDFKTVFESKERFEKAGTDCAEQILSSPTPFSAIICAYDDIAFGVIKHLTEQGIRIPEDISVIGFDNISVTEYLQTSLTTIDTHYEKMCNAAWNLLCKKIENKYYKIKKPISFTAELIVRDSVAKAK